MFVEGSLLLSISSYSHDDPPLFSNTLSNHGVLHPGLLWLCRDILDSKLAVATSASYGLFGNGRLFILNLTANEIVADK